MKCSISLDKESLVERFSKCRKSSSITNWGPQLTWNASPDTSVDTAKDHFFKKTCGTC